jgi:hypothetical protein
MPAWLRRVLSYAFFVFAVLAIIGMLAAMGFPVGILAVIPIGYLFFYKISRTISGKPMPQDALVIKVMEAIAGAVLRKFNVKPPPEQPEGKKE